MSDIIIKLHTTYITIETKELGYLGLHPSIKAEKETRYIQYRQLLLFQH